MPKTTNFCYKRSRNHYIGWALGSFFIAASCFPSGFLLLIDEPFTWGALIISVIGTIALAIFIRSLLLIFSPANGKLGKSVRPYMDGSIHTDVKSMFALIDEDIVQNGKKFGYARVGKKWILGGEAMLIERIRGIFCIKIIRSKRREYGICLVDDHLNVQTTNLSREKHLDELNDYLTHLLPYAATGDFDDYLTFIAKDNAEMEAFNEEFVRRSAAVNSEYVLTESDDIPTSLVTPEKIRHAINTLQPGQRILLSACNPPESKWGRCTGISCHCFAEDGRYALAAYFETEEGDKRRFVLRFVPLTQLHAVWKDFFENAGIPDVDTWEDQSDRIEPVEPMEDYVLYVDGHKYDHIIYEDVEASLENLEEGKCEALLLRTPGWKNGYLEVRGTKDDYIVEVAGFDGNHEVRGYCTSTTDGESVRYWLSEYYHNYRYPEVEDNWEDITEEVRRKSASSN